MRAAFGWIVVVAGLTACGVLIFRLFWRDRGDWTRVPRSTWTALAAITGLSIALAQGVVWALGTVVAGLALGLLIRALMARRRDS